MMITSTLLVHDANTLDGRWAMIDQLLDAEINPKDLEFPLELHSLQASRSLRVIDMPLRGHKQLLWPPTTRETLLFIMERRERTYPSRQLFLLQDKALRFPAI